jgi:hypothetical protein
MLVVAALAALFGGPGLAAPDDAEPAATYRFFVLNEPHAGQEDAYLRFYDEYHLADVVSIPGFVEGRRYILNDHQLAPKPGTPAVPRYLTLYTIRTADLDAVKAEIARRLATGETRRSATYDPQASVSFTYREIGPLHRSAQPDDTAPGRAGAAPADYLHFVQTVARPGHERAYDRWYVEHHLSEMIQTRGFRTAQRLELADGGRGSPPRARYAALFGFRTADDEAVIAAFRAGAARRTPSDAADREATRGYTFRAIGPALTHEDALARRRAR